MSTQSPAAPAARSALPSSAADLVLATPTRIRTSNGEYLDVQPARDGLPAHFVTVPISRLQHAFRVHRVQDIRNRRWKVELEPVPLGGAAVDLASAGQTAAPRYPMELADHGCVDFELSFPKKDLLAQPATNRAPHGIAPLYEEEPATLRLDVDVVNLAAAASSTAFPVFSGDSKVAFDYIASELHVDPHSAIVDELLLQRIERPQNINQAAWKEVMDQLFLEVRYRRVCSDYFQSIREFTQNVFINNNGLVNTIGSLIELEDSFDKLIHLGVSGMFKGIASGVGALGFPGAGVVSGGLNLAFDFVLKDQGPDQAELTVAYADVRDALARKFDELITKAQRAKIDTFVDWGKLKQLGESLEMNNGQNRWPADDSAMRAEAARLFEISLWKALLKVKWHHMTSSENPTFYEKYDEGNKQGMEAAHKNYWIDYRPGKGTPSGGFKEKDGFFVDQHWLGYGNVIGLHREPHNAMCERLFGPKLNINRRDVFMDTSWGLTPETFYVANPMGM